MSISIPSELYENNDPEYQKLIASLQILVQERKENEYINLLKQICFSYMLPYKTWAAIYEFISQTETLWLDCLEKQEIFQLFYATENDDDDITYFDLNEYEPKLISVERRYTKRKCGLQVVEVGYLNQNVHLLANDLTFPNSDLDHIFRYYEKQICKLPPKEIIQAYKKSKNLYNKLIQLNIDDDEWSNEIFKADDLEFIEHNIAHKLGRNLFNKELWEKYLKFLEEKNDMKKVLYAFSKYCRVFPNDNNLKNRYKAAVEQHSSGSIAVPWYNPYDFEKCDKAFFNKDEEQDDRPLSPEYESLKIHYNSENAMPQQMAFRKTLIDYLQKFANGNIRLKLSFSCKYFGSKMPFICYKMNVTCHMTSDKFCFFYQQSVNINYYDIDELNIKNIYILNVLNIQSKHKMFLSKLIKRMISCTVKYLTIVNQDITLDELKFLTQHGNVEELMVRNTIIKHSNGDTVYLEEILETVPKLKRYFGREFQTRPLTMSKLMEIPFENKLELFDIPCTNINHFTPEMFVEFLKAKATMKSSTSVTFPSEYEDDERTEQFRKDVLSGINLYWQEPNTPEFHLLFLEP